MEAKKRPPRKFFFSAIGTPGAVKLTFVSEPRWQQREKGEALCATIHRGGTDGTSQYDEELEQYTPDAYDLSQALVAILGGTVVGQTCRITPVFKRVPSARRPGTEVSVIDKFLVERA